MASIVRGSRSADIHKQLSHPVVDGDAHWLESVPVFHDYLKATGGQSMLDEYIKTQASADRYFQTPPADRVRQRMGRPNYWFGPGNTLDRATSMIPKLMYERLPDFGIDFAIVYPTLGLGGFQGANRVQGAGLTSDLRRCCVRAYNIMAADMFRAYADRMTPAAIIPTVTPAGGRRRSRIRRQDAWPESWHAARRHSASNSGRRGLAAGPSRRRHYFDNLALDSPYDYDPLWAKMVELGLAYTSHSGSSSDTATRTSPTSVVQSRVGHFAQAHQIALKGLLLGGVPHRFPTHEFRLPRSRRRLGSERVHRPDADLHQVRTRRARARPASATTSTRASCASCSTNTPRTNNSRGRVDRIFDGQQLVAQSAGQDGGGPDPARRGLGRVRRRAHHQPGPDSRPVQPASSISAASRTTRPCAGHSTSTRRWARASSRSSAPTSRTST